MAILAGGIGGPLTGESVPRRLAILAGGGGGPMLQGSALRRRLAGRGRRPLDGGECDVPPGHPGCGALLAILTRGDGDPTKRESAP